MKKVMLGALALFSLTGCSVDSTPAQCKNRGYQGILIHNHTIGLPFTGDACSNGLKNPNETHWQSEDGLLMIDMYVYTNLENFKE